MRKAFVEQLTLLAEKDQSLFLLTGDMGFAVFEDFKERFPQQYLNAGLSEQSMIGMAAGLALEGKKVFVYSIIPFVTYRALEQIRNDLCYQQLPVRLIGVGTGFAYGGLGGTHHGIDDVGVMSSLPGMMVFSPCDPLEVTKIIMQSVSFTSPAYIRLNRAGDPILHSSQSIKDFKIGEPLKVYGNGEDIIILSTGSITAIGLEVAKELEKQGMKTSLYSIHTLQPLETSRIEQILEKAQTIVVLEESVRNNGLATIIRSIKEQQGSLKPLLAFYLPNQFTHTVGSQEYLRNEYGLSKNNLVQKIQEALGKVTLS